MFGPIAVIAGNGALPLEICSALRQQNRIPHFVAIQGEAKTPPQETPSIEVSLTQFGKLWNALEKWKISEIIFCGGITKRPDLNPLKIDAGTMRVLPEIVAALVGGDDAVLRSVATIFESRGYKVVGAAEIAPNLLASAGVLGDAAPSATQRNDLETAFRMAKGLGAMDAGQAAIVERGRALALEAAEGTEAMLRRVAELRKKGTLSNTGGGVLVKCAKPNQDLRFDLPTIGPETLLQVAEAGLTAIGVEENKSIVLDQMRIIGSANKGNIVLYGFESDRSEPRKP